jgi:hypothetical protein
MEAFMFEEGEENYTIHSRLKYAHNILRNGWHQIGECTQYRATKAAESGYNLVISENERAINARLFPRNVYPRDRLEKASALYYLFGAAGTIFGLGEGVGIAIYSIPLAAKQFIRPSKPSSSNLLHRPDWS